MAAAPALHELDERTLVARAVRRDRDAFAALYDRYVVRVYRRLYRVTGSASEAEDLTAQTFLQAWQAIDRYEERGAPFVAWLLRIAHNLGVTYLRSKREQAPLPERLVDPATRRNPEDAVERQLAVERLREALLGLRGTYRLVLLLRFFEELAYAEVAQLTGKSVPAVRLLQHRALHALRQRLERDATGEALDDAS